MMLKSIKIFHIKMFFKNKYNYRTYNIKIIILL